MMEQCVVNPDYQKWLVKLMGYHFDIQYWPGLENKAAYTLSRINSAVKLMTITVPKVLSLERPIEEVRADESLGKIMNDIEANQVSYPGYLMSHG